MRNISQMNEKALANSFAVVGLAGYILCVLATAIFPEFLMTLFNSWFHGLDLSTLRPADGNWVFGTGNLVLGLITFPIFSWVIGYFIARMYNRFTV